MEAKVGTEMNVIKDVIFEGKILDMVKKATEFVQGQIREYTFLNKDGRFITIPEIPEFCWKELIVNAIGHRDYSILGTDIQIKMFDDHLTVESPGTLPGLVKTSNIREIHFLVILKYLNFSMNMNMSKNLKKVLIECFVKCLLRDYLIQNIASLNLCYTQHLKIIDGWRCTPPKSPQDMVSKLNLLLEFCSSPRTLKEMQEYIGLSDRNNFRKNYLHPLLKSGKFKMTRPDKPNSREQSYVRKEG